MGFIGDLFNAGGDILGGITGGLFGGGGDGGGIFGLGLDIFGGGGGLFNSPIFGHVLGGIGQALMAPDADDYEEQAAAVESGRRRAVRESYGLPGTPSGNTGLYVPRPSTA